MDSVANTFRPITPNEARENRNTYIPDEILKAVNTLLAEKLGDGNKATIKVKEIIELAHKFYEEAGKKTPTEEEIRKNGWLDIEKSYCEYGWSVRYDHACYGEDWFEPRFVFVEKKQ